MIAELHEIFIRSIQHHDKIEHIRQCGTILAMTLHTTEGHHYLSSERDRIYHYFINRGILLRPIGNVLYLIPPYCIQAEQLTHIYQCIREFLDENITQPDLAIV